MYTTVHLIKLGLACTIEVQTKVKFSLFRNCHFKPLFHKKNNSHASFYSNSYQQIKLII